MLQTEFVRSLHCNYERILLDKKPEEKKYQYCILSRGGIKGLLPFSLRYMNGLAYLYYDISSKQNIIQLFDDKCITREWVKDFVWSLRQIQMELGRFLLNEQNVLWYPEQIFQDLEKNVFSFLYIPYYQGEGSFIKLLEFMVEHIDYEDEELVELVYKMHEQYERNGEVYLQEQIFEDVKKYLQKQVQEVEETFEEESRQIGDLQINKLPEPDSTPVLPKDEKKGILAFWENRRRKDKEIREDYAESMQQAMLGYAVAEDSVYAKEDYGNTIYIEEKQEERVVVHKLYSPEGRLLAQLDSPTLTIGKKKEGVMLCLEDISVSRLHARIVKEGEEAYIEDLNSTNGTFKNGLRLRPYEKRKLEEGDEIKCGKKVLIYR